LTTWGRAEGLSAGLWKAELLFSYRSRRGADKTVLDGSQEADLSGMNVAVSVGETELRVRSRRRDNPVQDPKIARSDFYEGSGFIY
jgi:hypothetical protein